MSKMDDNAACSFAVWKGLPWIDNSTTTKLETHIFSPKKTHHPSGTERENMAKNSMGFVGDIDLLQLSRQKKNLNGGLIGILIMVYYNPYISEVSSISLSQWTLK